MDRDHMLRLGASKVIYHHITSDPKQPLTELALHLIGAGTEHMNNLDKSILE